MANKKKPEDTPAPEPTEPEMRNGKPRWVKGPDGKEHDRLTLEPRK